MKDLKIDILKFVEIDKKEVIQGTEFDHFDEKSSDILKPIMEN